MLNKIMDYIPGLILAGIITALAFWLNANHIGASIGMSALTFAILLGMLVGNTVYGRVANTCHSGITFAKGILLRAGIVLYGFRITFQQIDAVGLNAIASDAIMLISTFFLTFYLGYKWLKIDKQIVYLSAAGCSICGAAAVMASEPVVRGESHKVAVAIAIVVIFGTIAMFVYPILYPYMTQYLSDHQFGIYIGSSVHEVAQVYAAGGNINPLVADDAVITKMIRVMMLAPFLLVLSYALAKESAVGGTRKINIPWFAVFFILVAVLNSFPIVPAPIVHWLVELDGILLMMAMAALGVTTHIGAIKQAGAKPLVLGLLVFIWLVVGGFVVNVAMQQVF
ncbi:YeiH family putative sulfate export transporter [Pasteurellaceae bacterium HPA106]|uniref:YeiH family putative sulfate export transporter n=1 Tax=Spirabiliibacterium pneumoniae TaxID=221400 RepID=UPI001AAC82F0|nr:YeiH family putative sulfate export transporter [Spirabiliibacterium pneumoniae]MBE2896085.1 YeiH family putative sulfate export transporter [Spirabiliibacterium pneumoniae]